MKFIAIIIAIMLLAGGETAKKSKQVKSQGIGTPAYHEPACGIGEAAYHEPGGTGE